MPKVVLLSDLYDPKSGEILKAGQEVDASEERAEQLIARGTAQTLADSKEASEPVKREGEVVEEFDADGNQYQHLQDAGGDFWTVNGNEIDETAFTSARQAQTQAELSANAAEANEEEAKSTTPLVETTQKPETPVQTPAGTTPDQILDDLKVAE